MVIPGNFDFRKSRIDKGELFGWIFTIYIMIQIVVYILAIIKWFITDHFSFWHGFKELIFALNHMDIPVIMGSTFIIAFLFIIINILVDITHFYLDPRIKYF